MLCSPWGRAIGLLVCTRRLSFHEFYNFLLLNFLTFIIFFFWKLLFYPRHLATPTTHDLYPRPTTHDPRHLVTLFAGKPLVASQNVGCFLSYHRNMSGKLQKVVMFMRLSILFLLSRPFQSLSMPSDCN